MAANDPLKRRPLPQPLLLNPRPPTVNEIGRTVGQGTGQLANLVGQGINQVPRLIGMPLAGGANIASEIGAGFMSGLTGTERTPTRFKPLTLQQMLAPSAPQASAPTTPVPNFNVPGRTLAPPLEGEALLRSGVTAPASTPRRMTPEEQVAYISGGPPRNLTPDGPPSYNTGSATRGTAQFGSGPVQSIPSNFGAGRTNVVPSFAGAAPAGVGGSASTYNPNSRLNFTPANPAARGSGAGSAESVALARSRELDGLFQSIMQQAQRQPRSYGELFARRGTLASLNALAGLSQAAGSNYIQGAGDVLQSETSRRGQDLGFESELGRQAVQARGQDLGFESNLGQQNVASQGNLLQALIAQQGQGVTERVGNRQAAATLESGRARAAATLQAAQNQPASLTHLQGLMVAQINQASGEEREARIAEYVRMFGNNPLIIPAGG